MYFNKLNSKIKREERRRRSEVKFRMNKCEEHLFNGRYGLYHVEMRKLEEAKKDYQEYMDRIKDLV